MLYPLSYEGGRWHASWSSGEPPVRSLSRVGGGEGQGGGERTGSTGHVDWTRAA
jgi:hypothetical protein